MAGIYENGCTFHWKIENLSLCWLERRQKIVSPYFNVDGTKWLLWLYPNGKFEDNYLGVELHRDQDCNGPDEIKVNFKISFLDVKGSFLKEFLLNNNFKKGACFYESEERKNIFVSNEKTFIPDILEVKCSIWKNDEKLMKSTNIHARTRFNVKSESYVWKIDSFSTLPSSIKSKFNDDLIDFEVGLIEENFFSKDLVINGIFVDESIKYFSFRIVVINLEGNEQYCVSKEFFAADIKKGIHAILLSSQTLREKKSRYFPNDTLILDCKYIYSTGTVSNCIYDCGTISTKITEAVVGEKSEELVRQPSTQVLPVLVNDLKTMYSEGIFSDMELRTSTKNFSAHKNILSARSPVFRRMFSNDMLEKNCGYIDIADLEADTVHRMLLYIYTDSLDGMQFENASNLYTAADKYDISTLKSRCSSFLKDNLGQTNACDILALADRHQDDDLKNYVQDFILAQDKEVFNSQEWRHFMTSNLQLAAEVMLRKVSLC